MHDAVHDVVLGVVHGAMRGVVRMAVHAVMHDVLLPTEAEPSSIVVVGRPPPPPSSALLTALTHRPLPPPHRQTHRRYPRGAPGGASRLQARARALLDTARRGGVRARSLLTTRYSPRTTHCSPRTAHYSLSTHHSLLAAHVLATHHSPLTTRCLRSCYSLLAHPPSCTLPGVLGHGAQCGRRARHGTAPRAAAAARPLSSGWCT